MSRKGMPLFGKSKMGFGSRFSGGYGVGMQIFSSAKCLFLLAGATWCFSLSAWPSVLVQYDFGAAGTPLATPSAIDANADDVTYSFTAGAGVSSGFGLSTSSGNPVASAYVNSTYLTEAISSSSTDYVTFSLAANTGYHLDLSTLTFAYAFTGGDSTQSATFGIRTSVNGFASDVGTINAMRQNTSGSSVVWSSTSVDFSAASFDSLTTIEIRIYLADSGTLTNSFVRLDNVTLNGASVAVPEPRVWMLCGVGAVVMFFRRCSLRRA